MGVEEQCWVYALQGSGAVVGGRSYMCVGSPLSQTTTTLFRPLLPALTLVVWGLAEESLGRSKMS